MQRWERRSPEPVFALPVARAAGNDGAMAIEYEIYSSPVMEREFPSLANISRMAEAWLARVSASSC
jgi:hypothetical protein